MISLTTFKAFELALIVRFRHLDSRQMSKHNLVDNLTISISCEKQVDKPLESIIEYASVKNK